MRAGQGSGERSARGTPSAHTWFTAGKSCCPAVSGKGSFLQHPQLPPPRRVRKEGEKLSLIPMKGKCKAGARRGLTD
ncbi:hypothetical protein E2C01_011546 [Portunus trituberculatus]|uniref:Uncharacterized protein n=1 Tax=Portunus trituberculatus TaxID=210409 RepID=A0A5B7DBD6_PORTR|nr:hypothetical protein [Portunus trituberculatus]